MESLDFFQWLISFSDYFVQRPMLGVAMGFFFAFIESLAVVGSLMPGIVLMSLVGYLMGTAAIPFWPTLIAIFIGAFLGDYLSYLVGYHYRPWIMKTRLYQNKKVTWEQGERLLIRYGIIGMIMGRMVGPVRSTLPLIAGLIAMPLPRFVVGAIGSVCVWMACYVTPSFLIGAYADDISLDLIFSIVADLVSYLVEITLVGALGFALWQSNQDKMRILFLLASLVLLATLVVWQADILIINDMVFNLMARWQSDTGLGIATLLSLFADKHSLYTYLAIAMLLLLANRCFWSFSFLLLGCISVGLGIKGVKMLVHSPRPEHVVLLLGPQAFPSGHVGLLTTVLWQLGSLINHHEPQWRIPWRLLSILIVSLVACARLYLGAHWLTDTLGGFLIGYLCYLAPLSLYQHWRIPFDHSKNLTRLLVILLPVLVILKPWQHASENVAKRYHIEHYRIDLNQASQTRYLSNAWGLPIYPLNVHFLGEANRTLLRLHQEGWHTRENPLTLYYQGQAPQWLLENSRDRRLLLALWQTPKTGKLIGSVFLQVQPEAGRGFFPRNDFQALNDQQLPFKKTTSLLNVRIPLNLRLQRWQGEVFSFDD